MLPEDVRHLFRPEGNKPVLVLTVGNPLRSDDGVGSWIASRARPPEGLVIVLDAGERPECAIAPASRLRPARTVILDAADFGGVPGETRIIPEDRIPDHALSTHSFPLPVVARLLIEDTGAPVFFIGIQPATVALGEALSPAVGETAAEIVRLIEGAGG